MLNMICLSEWETTVSLMTIISLLYMRMAFYWQGSGDRSSGRHFLPLDVEITGSVLSSRFFVNNIPLLFLYICSDFDRAVDKYVEQGFADYLRSKGFRVTKKLDIDDKEIINYLESYGYQVESLLEGMFYSTGDNIVGNPVESDSLRSVRGL